MKRITYSILFGLFFFIAGANLINAQALVQDFEGYNIGDSLAHIGWSATDIVDTVADDPLASGNKVLENTINNYNAAPVLMFVLPAGKTLADYGTFTFKSYWAQGDVGYKDIVVEAYQTMPTAQAFNDASVKIGSWNRAKMGSTAWEDITVDITNSLSLNDTIYIAFGINCAGTGDVGGTGVTTIWYADSVSLVPKAVDTTLVDKWGFLGGRIGNWKFTPGDAPGGASIGVNTTSSVEWAAIRGGFNNPVTATTDKAILVTGNIEFVGAGIDTWSGLRYGLFMHDSAGTLITSNVDSTRWSGSESYSHGYMFTPVSGTNRLTDGVSGGVGTNWVRISGNYISTSNGSGPIYFAGYTPQQPARAVADAGKYAFAFSVQPLADGTKEVRFYLIKGDAANSATSTYYFGGSFIDTSSIAPTFNGVCFAVHAGGSGTNPDLRGVKLTDVKVDVGTPFALPEAPWQAYYVDQWGFLGGRQGNWQFVPGDQTGNAGISVDATSSVEWAAIRGGFVEPVTATTDKAILVTGNIEFEGAGIDTWSGLRYGLFMHDSAGTVILDTATATLPDSTRWSGSESYSHGYMFTPVSGTNRLTDGVSGGVGTNWVRISGNYISTSNGSGPIYFAGYTPQQPARAVADAGKYAFAFSVQPLADGTKEVRFYLIKGDAANSATSTYYFGGSFIDTSSIAPTFNGVCFAVHAGGSGTNPDLRGVKLTDVKVDVGTPFALPVAPFVSYYVDQWGFFGGKIGGWSFTPGDQTGNATISGTTPNTDWAVLRGELPTFTPTSARSLKITGKVNFVGGGFDASSSFRFGIFYTDSAGTYILDTAAATLPDSSRWTGTDNHCTGYLFIPQSGSNGAVTWGDGNQGTWGAVIDDIWLNPAGSKNYVLGTQLPDPSTDGAGTYNFNISVTPQADGKQLVKFNLIKTGDYGFAGELAVNGPNMFNSIAFALNAGNSITALNVTDVKIDTGTITGVNDLDGTAALPVTYSLSQNYPNPFNPTTTIRFALPNAGDVSLAVYDILGRKVAELVHGNLTAGYHTVNFNASNLASGVYFYRIHAGDFVSVKKLMLLK